MLIYFFAYFFVSVFEPEIGSIRDDVWNVGVLLEGFFFSFSSACFTYRVVDVAPIFTGIKLPAFLGHIFNK